MAKVRINFCEVPDLTVIPGIGSQIAERIIALREELGNITPAVLASVPYLRNFVVIESLIDFYS